VWGGGGIGEYVCKCTVDANTSLKQSNVVNLALSPSLMSNSYLSGAT